jgi:hypothetical protein
MYVSVENVLSGLNSFNFPSENAITSSLPSISVSSNRAAPFRPVSDKPSGVVHSLAKAIAGTESLPVLK